MAGRFDVAANSFDVFLRNPYFGVGFGNKGNSQRVGGTSLFLEVDHNGNFEVEQSYIN